MTSGYASKAEHALNARIHLVFFDKFAAGYLIDADLHLFLKPLVIGEHLRHSFLQKLVGSTAGLGGKRGETGFLLSGQIHFHAPTVSGCPFGHKKAAAPFGSRGVLFRDGPV